MKKPTFSKKLSGLATHSIITGLQICVAVAFCTLPLMAGTPEANGLMDYFESVYQDKTLLISNMYPHTPTTYDSIGKRGAIWMRDLEFIDPAKIIDDYVKYRPIYQFHWHWKFDADGDGVGDGTGDENPIAGHIDELIDPQSVYYQRMMDELANLADTKLQPLKDAHVPFIFRPLHEIGGNWFFWTDMEHPENTAQLYRIWHDYFVVERGFDNIIWEFNLGLSLVKVDVEYARSYYPGEAYVDIIAFDMYTGDMEREVAGMWDYWNRLGEIAPGKMRALGEAYAVPNPDLMASGSTPRWLFAGPWWGAPSTPNRLDWARYTENHSQYITLDNLPFVSSTNLPDDLMPEVGIVAPDSEGRCYFNGTSPLLKACASDDGAISKVEFFARDRASGTTPVKIGESVAPYEFLWTNWIPGVYEITAKAYDDTGNVSDTSDMGAYWNWDNSVTILAGLCDVARYGTVTVSSAASSAGRINDGDNTTSWYSAANDNESVTIDLGDAYTVDKVLLRWFQKKYAKSFKIFVSSNNSDWTAVYYQPNYPKGEVYGEITLCSFSPIQARYVRLNCLLSWDSSWKGYDLASMEVPVPVAQTAGLAKHLALRTVDTFFPQYDLGTPWSAVPSGLSGCTYTHAFHDGKVECARIDYGATTGGFGFGLSGTSNANLSAYANGSLHFFARSSVERAYSLSVKDSAERSIKDVTVYPQWREYIVPVSEIAAVADLTSITSPFYIQKSGTVPATLYIMNVYWSTASAEPVKDIVLDGDFSSTRTYPVKSNINMGVDPVSNVSTHLNCDQGWIRGSATGAWAPNTGLGWASVQAGSSFRTLAQAVWDQKRTKGKRKLQFKMKNTETSGTANKLTARVWGAYSDTGFLMYNEMGPVDDGQPCGALLGEQELGGTTLTNWTTYTVDVDFGVGFNAVVIAFTARDVDVANGDSMEVDEVKIVADDPLPTATLEILNWSAGVVQLKLTGSPNSRWQIKRSSDLQTWTDVQASPLTLTNGTAQTSVQELGDRQFYRGRWVP